MQAGYESNADLNGERQDGVGRFQVTQRDGWRCSAAEAYLRPALERPNLELRPCAFVRRIAFDGNRAVGVEVDRGGEVETVRAEREEILCAGMYQSPRCC